jgi:hypothetical protein
MSYKRQQVERGLPDASPRFCDFLWHKLGEAGMNVQQEDILFLAKLTRAYFETPEGAQTALVYLKSEAKPVSVLRTYFKAGRERRDEWKVNATKLKEFHGYLHQEIGCVPWSAVEVDAREDADTCDSCGGRYPIDYCMTKVEVPKQTGQLVTEKWCNHCRYNHEHPKVRQTGDQRKCAGCEKIACEFHPQHPSAEPQRPVALLAPARAAGDGLGPIGWR